MCAVSTAGAGDEGDMMFCTSVFRNKSVYCKCYTLIWCSLFFRTWKWSYFCHTCGSGFLQGRGGQEEPEAQPGPGLRGEAECSFGSAGAAPHSTIPLLLCLHPRCSSRGSFFFFFVWGMVVKTCHGVFYWPIEVECKSQSLSLSCWGC